MRIDKTKNRKRRRGTAAVEFAITAPALLLVIFCTFEFARISMLRNIAHNAAYEAARISIVEGATMQEGIDEANRILARLGTQNATVDINGGAAMEFDTETVDVHIEIPMESNAFFFPMFYRDKMITADASMNTERYKGFYNAELE